MNILTIALFLIPMFGFSQNGNKIETSDIANFWRAFDQLNEAQTLEDSIRIMQQEYIDKASKAFKKFIRVRDFTAKEYVAILAAYPKFWKSIRPLTENIVNRKGEIENVFEQFSQKLPGFRRPEVCFAIGCLRTGGTTTNDLILIGAEISASDSTVEKSELSPWLKSVIGKTGDIVSMVAHEAVHTQQKNKMKSDLLTGVLSEGIADFITVKLLGLNINSSIHQYGTMHECDLWKAFEKDMENTPKDMSNWLYQGNESGDRPADLGYFIGFKIAESYYEKQPDKKKALKTLLNKRKYKKVFNESQYWTESCSR